MGKKRKGVSELPIMFSTREREERQEGCSERGEREREKERKREKE